MDTHGCLPLKALSYNEGMFHLKTDVGVVLTYIMKYQTLLAPWYDCMTVQNSNWMKIIRPSMQTEIHQSDNLRVCKSEPKTVFW